MLQNLNTKTKLLLFPLMFIIIVILSAGTYLKYSGISEKRNAIAFKSDEFIETLLKGRISVYQFLRTPTETNAQKVRDTFLLLENEVSTLKKDMIIAANRELSDEIINYSKKYISDFDLFSSKLIENSKNGIKEESSDIKNTIVQMAESGVVLGDKIKEINKNALNLKNEAQSLLNTILLILVIVSMIIFISFSLFLANNIVKSLSEFKNGLMSFFSYLNRMTNKVSLLDDKAKDEFGEMAKFVNINIKQIEKTFNEDFSLIEDAKIVMKRVNNGWYSQLIEKRTSNSSLEEFKSNVNNMINSTKERFEQVDLVLEHYSRHDYTKVLKLNPNDEKGGVLERLVTGINTLQNSITQMLVDNKTNGLTLGASSNILLVNVDKLNQSSNKAAASLEETAAAIEEITSNIRNNTESISKMAVLSGEVTNSANQGEKLASETTVSMDEINEQVGAINEAISVIDQIAFQTNILSLNAAVEAATAGEAGRGFAVVAQEVRNLASRSADAAKEIKTIVENATNKANHGKKIASNMIHGYKQLNENIALTINLIEDIQNASKEQLLGIEQINDAVNSLDQQTQENANVASQAYDVAVITDKIAKLVVSNADEKEFNGKKEAHAQTMDLNKGNIQTPVKKVEYKKAEEKKIETKKIDTSAKKEVKIITSSKSKDDDEWESF